MSLYDQVLCAGDAKARIAALVTGVSCPTTSACLGVDNNGSIFTSTAPFAGTASPAGPGGGKAQPAHHARGEHGCLW